ncbi:uncharacterized protein LOC117643708 [Thrips palmi]|uniref:Odorant receptor n=1 Tax=Thrips palmi TaxID=161013 RepID=A0A6P8YFZ2_THRPL|nr:uncharacterized protein LOC117643708 [Thrips palmi]
MGQEGNDCCELNWGQTALVLIVAMTLLALVDTVQETSGRPLAERVSMRTMSAGISCTVSLVILSTRKRVILDALHQARQAALQLEADPTAEGKVEMAAEARWGRLVLWRVSATYAAGVVMGVVLTMLYDDSTVVNKGILQLGQSVAWWQPWGPQALLRVKWVLVELCAVCCCQTALFTVLFFEQAMHRVCAVLLREVGRRLQDRQSAALVYTVSVHIGVLRACRLMNAVFGLLLPFYLVISVGLSLLSTVALVQSGRGADTYAVSCFPYLFIFFVPMCLAGQRVQDASQGLLSAAYRGPWLEEDVRARRSRLMLMTSCSRPATFSTPGVGCLNRPTCRKGLRSWFQFVQVLMNLKTH